MNEYHQMKPDHKMNKTFPFPTVYLSKLIKSIGKFCKENPKLSDITNLIIIDFTCSDNHFETVNYEEALETENPEDSMNTKYHLGKFNETIFVDRDSRSNSISNKSKSNKSKSNKSKGKKSKGRQFNETVKSRFGGRTRKTKGKTK
jgi:hypothetical protein